MIGESLGPGGVELRASGTLVERALAALRRGPMATHAVAEEILALRGNPGAAAAAVFALLGSDPRFRVDGSGVWSLSHPRPERGIPFAAQEWVVVDVETTGGSPGRGHRVIEFAAVRVRDGRICGQYASLVNPLREVPRMITSLTGISNADVAFAPTFDEIAGNVARALRGRVFVAHNASFDWRFVGAEMERCVGRAVAGRRLCTLRLARRLLPNLPSRSLGALAHYYGIGMARHHRALEDALATAELLLRFLERLGEMGITDWDGLEDFFRPPSRRARRTALPVSMDAA